uniref:Autophagy-related protein 101 n=1 Tax=Junco hyemalis TaxID=40217 RepID=A0A8C5IE11_JUNHY
MNCRAEVLEVSVEGRQVEEAMLAVLHTVLLHRSTGKFHYKKEGTYSIGTVGTQDVDCDFIDFAYVRVSSEELDRALRKAVGEFKDALRSSGSDGMGQISLEFYQKKKSRWPFSDECIPWELWTIKVNVVNLANEQERQICREKPEGRAALPVQDLLPDHGLPGHLGHHHHAPAHQGHAGAVGLVAPRQGHRGTFGAVTLLGSPPSPPESFWEELGLA